MNGAVMDEGLEKEDAALPLATFRRKNDLAKFASAPTV
jgi:hypothetical protein